MEVAGSLVLLGFPLAILPVETQGAPLYLVAAEKGTAATETAVGMEETASLRALPVALPVMVETLILVALKTVAAAVVGSLVAVIADAVGTKAVAQNYQQLAMLHHSLVAVVDTH